MKTFIVPTDFSETALNAAKFAVQLAAGVENSEVILYNVFDDIKSSTVEAAVKSNVISRHELMVAILEKMKSSLLEGAPGNIRVFAESGELMKNLPVFVETVKADMIIMGINGASRLSQVFMGSNAINIISETSCPVLIVPPGASFKGMKKVLLASDFKNVAETIPGDVITRVLNMYKPELHIANVDQEHFVELTEDYKKEKEVMDSMFGSFNPEYAFMRFFDFEEGIDAYANDMKINMIITIPRKHSFLAKIFKTSHTRELAFHTNVPLLAVHN
ncbi:MAG: universal stress protein [Chitinophagaceae bacterium]